MLTEKYIEEIDRTECPGKENSKIQNLRFHLKELEIYKKKH